MKVIPRILDAIRAHETFCIVGAEAISHGIPVVAARLGALRNLIEHERTGLLFAPGDIADMAAQMRRLWDDPALARHLGTAARAHVTESYNAEVHLARLRSAYARALCQKLQ